MKYRGPRMTYRGLTVEGAAKILALVGAGKDIVYLYGTDTTPEELADSAGHDLPADGCHITFALPGPRWVEGTLADLVTARLGIRPRRRR